jgi:hypothetical protein
MADGVTAGPVRMRARASLSRREVARSTFATHSTRFVWMSESQSRVLLATEAIMICAPLTVLLLFREIPAQLTQLMMTPDPETLGIFVSGLFMLIALVCLWRMIVAFTAHGRGALRRASVHGWAIVALAAALALRTAYHFAPPHVVQRSWLNAFGWGLPFFIPLLHLTIERWRTRP